MAALGPSVAHYLSHSLAPNTHATYRSGWSSYQLFCATHQVLPLPPTDLGLSSYASHLADRLITHSTIQVYLSAIAFHSQLRGHRIDYQRLPGLHYVLLGIHRVQGGRLSRPLRNPITTHHMLTLRAHLAHTFSTHDALALWAAFSSAFFGLLRSSEYSCPSSSTFSAASLLGAHLSFAPDNSAASLFLPKSKTDRFARGAHISLFAVPSPLCPVSALWHFSRIRRYSAGLPLFTLDDGHFLTRDLVVSVLRSAFPTEPNLNTHSFRIGGASALAEAGVPEYVIQAMGRWSSDSFLRYIRTPRDSLRSFHHRMSYIAPS